MKKRRIAIMVITLVLCVSLMTIAAIRILATGKDYKDTDGIWKNTHFYMENAYCENGTVHVSIVNKTYKRQHTGGQGPYVEYKQDGEWIPLVWSAPMRAIARIHKPFSTSEDDFKLERVWAESGVAPKAGEYRLIYGGPYYEEIGDAYTFPEDRTYLIAYLTVTEDML